MLINKLNIFSEFFLYLLIFGITFSNATVETSIGFIILIFLIKKFIFRKINIPITPLNILLYVFWIVIFISFLRSAHFKESIRGTVRILKYTLFYFSVADFLKEDKKRLIRLFWALIYISGFSFLNGIFQDIFGFDFLRHRQIDKLDYLHRINASFVTPNDFGAFIISVLPLTFLFLSREIPKNKKIILFSIFVLGFFCLIRTSSRSAWLGFLIGAIIFFLYFGKRLYILIPLIIFIFFIFSPHALFRITNIFSLEKNTVWERFQLWKGTWNMIKEHPLLGFGINTYSEYFPKYKPPEYPDIRYTHNSYLQMWSEIGIVGLIIFLSIVFTVLGLAFRNLRKKIKLGFRSLILLGLIAGNLGFLIQSGLDTNLYSLVLFTLFWLLIAYTVSLNKFLEDELYT
jgi:O-antigen ligase